MDHIGTRLCFILQPVLVNSCDELISCHCSCRYRNKSQWFDDPTLADDSRGRHVRKKKKSNLFRFHHSRMILQQCPLQTVLIHELSRHRLNKENERQNNSFAWNFPYSVTFFYHVECLVQTAVQLPKSSKCLT